MGLPLYQVDSFTSEPFKGNPAAVCLLDGPRPDEWMQAVAAEMNLSETAFLLAENDGYRLRWFTPAVEVNLCGHATLASAYVLWESRKARADQLLRFHTRSGVLEAFRQGTRTWLDFPAVPVSETVMPVAVLDALGVTPKAVLATADRDESNRNYLLELDSETAVRDLQPRFDLLRSFPGRVIVTAKADGQPFDFVSRFFAGSAGIDEDPVTGSAHCSLSPFWSQKLGKSELTGYQASKRGGVVHCRLKGDRVHMGGHALMVFEGSLRM